MKKFLGLLFIFICCQLFVCAENICPSTYELTSGWSKFISRASGSNFIHKTMLERYLEKQAQEQIGGKFDIKIESFSARDLKQGKFKSITAKAQDLVLDDVTISQATLSSICDYNQLDKTGNSAYRFVTDFPANLTFELSSKDIDKITQTTEFKKNLKEINSILRGMLSIDSVNFDVSDSRLWYNFVFSTPFSPKKQVVRVGTNLRLNNGVISTETVDSSSRPTVLSILNMIDALNFINPLDFSSKILENKIVNINFQEIYVKDDKVILRAFVNVRK